MIVAIMPKSYSIELEAFSVPSSTKTKSPVSGFVRSKAFVYHPVIIRAISSPAMFFCTAAFI